MAPVTACLPCRQLKARCTHSTGDATCDRCLRLGLECEIRARRMGRKLGSKNRKSRITSTTDQSGASTPRAHRSPVNRQDEASSSGSGSNLIAGPSNHGLITSLSLDAAPGTSPLSSYTAATGPSPLSLRPASRAGTSQGFSRSTFLSTFRNASRTLDADPYKGMAILEQGLGALISPEDEKDEAEEEKIIYARVDQPRRDLKPEYDVLASGMIDHRDVSDLLDMYWKRCHPLIRILDPDIYTLHYLQATSSLLLTAVLCAAAQSLPVSQHTLSLVNTLDQHMDRLLLELHTHGYQSMEICQALVIHSTYLRGAKQYQTWDYTSRAICMGLELRLDTGNTPAWLEHEAIHHHIAPRKMSRNIQRTWMVLLHHDRALAFIRGRRSMIQQQPLLKQRTLDSWWQGEGAIDTDVMLCATLALRIAVESIQTDVPQAVANNPQASFEQFLVAIDHELAGWQQRWLSRIPQGFLDAFVHDMKCARFVLLMSFLEHNLASGGVEGTARDECLVASMEVCKTALPFLSAGLQPQYMGAQKFYLIGYTAFSALRIMDATPMSADPYVDLFHLSILSSLSLSLIHFKVHANLGSIASVLGRRLLAATRKLATRIVGTGEVNSADNSNSLPAEQGSITVAETGTSPFTLITDHAPLALGMPATQNTHDAFSSLDPQDLAFSFDLTHLGDFVNLLGGDMTMGFQQASQTDSTGFVFPPLS